MRFKKIYVAGENGLVGSNIIRHLKDTEANIISTNSSTLDLRNRVAVEQFFDQNKPDCVILVAAKHGGIGAYANSPVEYFEDNLQICSNVIRCAYEFGVERLINIGASCVYEEKKGGLLKECDYDNSAVQKSTEPYGLAKLCGIKLCEYYNQEKGTEFVSVLPTNLYGNGIGYTLDESSVLPSMLKRFYHAKQNELKRTVIWGDGKVHREFLHISDFVRAISLLINTDELKYTLYNLGSGEVVSINELATMVADIVGYHGEIVNDLSKPNGANRGVLECSRIHELGWEPKIFLYEGIREMYLNWENGLRITNNLKKN